jgi:hypothetical protein
MQSKAATVAEYIASLPPDRREAIEAVRKVILKNLDKTYQETMQYGMIGYNVPHSAFPAGYHCDPKQPLPFAGLASQKNHMSVYMMSVSSGCIVGPSGAQHNKWFRDQWAKSGKKLDMGKSCIRFKKVDDLALDVIGEAIKRVPAKLYIQEYESLLASMGKTPKPAKKATKPAKKVAKTAKKAAKKATTR